jgi:hypothetical protein
VHEASRAPQGEPLDYEALGSVPPAALGSVRLRLRPSVRLVASPHPVLAIWEANLGDRDGTPARSEGPDRVAVHRAGVMEPVAVAVGAAEWTLLQAFARGENLAQAAAACSECALEFEPALAALGLLDVLGGFERDAP